MSDADKRLLTADICNRLLLNALAPDRDHFPVCKLFTPDAQCTWLITELDPDDPDRLFGLCDLGLGFPELGFVRFSKSHPSAGASAFP